MKIGVMGAGAVGCYYGAMLAKAGHEVSMVGRQSFVDGVSRDGLQLERQGETRQVRVAASSGAGILSESDIVLFSVKSTDTEAAGQAMAAHIRPEAIVLSFQNGVDNAERLARITSRTVVPVVVYVAAEMAGPSRVKHNGRGEIVIGATARSEAIAAMFMAAGVTATVSDRVTEALWQKLIINCAYNALSAASQLPYGRMMQVNGVADTMADAVSECVAVARAHGVNLPEPDMRDVYALSRTMPDQLSSTAQDLARNRPTEIDHLNGYIVRRGRELGIATPANQALYAIVKLIESRQATGRPN
jgi:2-dehydropantoate 2-reductase